MKVHLVDGTYELFRMYFGAPKALGPGGREVGATRALLRSIHSLLADPEVTHVGVAFDHVIESFRNDLFHGYKTGAGIEPELLGQFELAEEAVRALGLVAWPMIEFEADDAIASAAYAFAPLVEQVGVGGRGAIVLHDRRQRIVYDVAAVGIKFGVGPASIPDFLALVGDTADGIPGLPKWGPKSAATVLAHYRHLEHIPPSSTAWAVAVRGAEALSHSLQSARGEALLYRTLATLRTDAPIGVGLDDLAWRGADRRALETLTQAIGDEGFVERVTRSYFGGRSKVTRISVDGSVHASTLIQRSTDWADRPDPKTAVILCIPALSFRVNCDPVPIAASSTRRVALAFTTLKATLQLPSTGRRVIVFRCSPPVFGNVSFLVTDS
jgi:5'-3' exonuclease